MRIASIDIGTNTILLLVGEIKDDQIIPLREEFRIPRLGKSISSTQMIEEDSQLQLIQILNEYKQIAQIYNVEKIICGGTAVFRKAKNSNEVIKKVLKETGILINVLSSEQEAVLTFLGGISNFNEYYDKDFIVIDIGGGSTEITKGNLNTIEFLKSYNIGAVTLKDRFFNSYPYQTKIEEIYNYLNYIFTDELRTKNAVTISVAGTPTTIASIFLKQKVFEEKAVDKTYLMSTYLNHLINEFYQLSPDQISSKFPSVVRGREDVILPGTIILKFIMDRFSIKGLYVSTRGIRYGMIIWETMNYGEGFWTNVGLRKLMSSLFG
ncbi:MAG: hypothetical protein WHV63_08550 [Ignavibacteria bacterium]